MNSLSTRLFAAFAVTILAVVLMIGVALLFLLRDSALVERPTLARLNDAARLALRQNPLPRNISAEAANHYVTQLADTLDVRALLVTANGSLIADSDTTGADALTLNPRQAQAGRARDAQRNLWLYVARPAGNDQFLVLAAAQPRFPVLEFFVQDMLPLLLEAGGVAILLAIILAVIISRSIANPLQKMAVSAQNIARGDYSHPAPTNGPDEVRALGQSLNAMSQQVQASQQTQRDFLANVSHELKTPLTSIQGFAQALSDGTAATPEAVQRSAGIIYDEAGRMHRLVEELLELARLDTGLRTLKRAPLDLRLILTATVEKFDPRAKDNDITLQSDFSPVLPAMVGDAERLMQVFTNLLDNALKHTPAGGKVTLAAYGVPAGVQVTVADTGAGIPAEDLPRIFERFYQVDKARTHAGGMGLGLAITKEIVEAHGGSVHAESVTGLGTKFTVQLPLTRPDDLTVVKRK